ncbi:Multidrug resistance protein NorM [Paraburkholderia aspalathi]|uniref:MATE family efflux transporter n=1 Tax=Paraburkholderia aspalathi TaxID=1324617 RepID=UPI0019097DAA|nr:MATE family efflux transporter [Paraburkholderia aspalathi]MBK3844014.1 MATE family efflux transporter [Paraburkholderia aspalathi]CAE6865374.1 Multidrug resistance protein NorM [Paraburkholderia aspalathi]CAE6867292.1 Multidrug resistance protein NorM [Paraburkholderia aspalathi]
MGQWRADEAWARNSNELFNLHRISLPLAAVFIVETLMAFTDRVIVGRLGTDELAALGLTTRVAGDVTYVVCLCILSIGNVLAARALAANDEATVGAIVRHSLFLALLLSVPVTGLIYNIEPMLNIFGQPPNVSKLAGVYGRAAAWSVLPLVWFCVLRDFRAVLSNLRSVVFLILAAALANAFLASTLVYGLYGFPKLGILGAGIGTSMVAWGLLATEVLSQIRKPMTSSIRFLFAPYKRNSALIGSYFNLGLPVAANSAAQTSLWLTLNLLVGSFGATAQAANQIVLGIVTLVFMVPEGVREAVTIRAAHHDGHSDFTAVFRAALLAGLSNACFLLPFSVLMLLAPNLLASVFVDTSLHANADVLSISKVLFSIAAVYQIVDGVQIALIGTLKGLGDTRAPFVIGIFGYLLVGIGFGSALAFGLSLGPSGLWIGLALGILTTSSLLFNRLRTLTKRRLHDPLASAGG